MMISNVSPLQSVNDFVIKFANVNGTGSASANKLFAKALFRMGLPSVILRYAGGREVTLRELQAMGLTAGINALIVGNYLTTLGRSPDEDLRMLDDLQMPIGVLSNVI